jgi:hypothetical protein
VPRSDAFRPELESLLVEELCLLLPSFLRSRHAPWDVFREVTVGGSIADVVAVAGCHCGKEHPTVGPLSAAESVVLAVLRAGGPACESDLVKTCGLNGKTARTVKHLETAGLVRRRPNGAVEALRVCRPARSLVAVEAKLVRWRDALSQATTYRRYADEAFVALPEAHARPAVENAQEFRAAGVGLLIVGSGRVRAAIAAARSSAHGWEREFVFSRVGWRGPDGGDDKPARRSSRSVARAHHC